MIWFHSERAEIVGRRNHFGSKSARGTVVAATLYSLVESAKVAGVDPVAYLVEVATRARRLPLPGSPFLRRWTCGASGCLADGSSIE